MNIWRPAPCAQFSPRSLLLSLLLVALAWTGPVAGQTSSQQDSHPLTPDEQHELRSYIHAAWKTLSRSMTECNSLADPKLTTKPVLYVPAELEIPSAVRELESKCGVHIALLPRQIRKMGDVAASEVQPPGLLYLPYPYIVPGGRFNEMYGWDSYFIIRGLLRDGEADSARDMIENFFFEIEHYGSILNANRTYYFTRSQPPFLTSMIMSYYDAQKASGKEDRQWLGKAYDYAVRDYELWKHDPKLAGSTGLSRYFDIGEGPVPEMGDDPSYYGDVTSSLLTLHESTADAYFATSQDGRPVKTIGPVFNLDVCAETKSQPTGGRYCAHTRHVSLSEDFYKGDRAMRESGFDPSFRFGPFDGSTHHYAPVCLNSLLYKAEEDLSRMAEILGQSNEAAKWKQLAEERKVAINKYLWNAQAGMFFDYDFQASGQSTYHYVTTFYPLWAGLATPEQARAVVRNVGLFDQPGGMAMSDRDTGTQWDLPYGWAPLQLLCVEGMLRYGFTAEADRISQQFVSDVYDNFERDHTIREKYNVLTRATQATVATGYKTNEVGFGWTNGVTLVLMDRQAAAH